MELFKVWKLSGYDTISVFGVPWVSLAWYDREDLSNLHMLEEWYEIDAKAKPADGLPSIGSL